MYSLKVDGPLSDISKIIWGCGRGLLMCTLLNQGIRVGEKMNRVQWLFISYTCEKINWKIYQITLTIVKIQKMSFWCFAADIPHIQCHYVFSYSFIDSSLGWISWIQLEPVKHDWNLFKVFQSFTCKCLCGIMFIAVDCVQIQ